MRVITVYIFHATPFTGLLALSSIKRLERKDGNLKINP